jgi:hypothetical protein
MKQMNKIVSISAGLCLLVVIFQSFSVLGSSSLNRLVQVNLNAPGVLLEEDRTLALERLALSRNLDGDNPETLLLTAYLEPDLNKRLELLTAVVAVRPVSGRAWAELFRTRLKLEDYGTETSQALQQAIVQGGWEPGVQLAIIDAGSRHWPALADDDKASVALVAKQRLKGAAIWQRREAVTLLKERGFLALVCAGIEANPLPLECQSG